MTREDLIKQGLTQLIIVMPVPCSDFELVGLPEEFEMSPFYNSDNDTYTMTIDLIEKKVIGWTEQFNHQAVDIFNKVVDCGEYYLLNKDGEKVYYINGYVPGLLDFGGDSYGDYLELSIDKNGFIDWADVEFEWPEDWKSIDDIIEDDED